MAKIKNGSKVEYCNEVYPQGTQKIIHLATLDWIALFVLVSGSILKPW
jgi:hypothetical protein